MNELERQIFEIAQESNRFPEGFDKLSEEEKMIVYRFRYVFPLEELFKVINMMIVDFPEIKERDLGDKTWEEVAKDMEQRTILRKEWYDRWLRNLIRNG